MQLDRDEVVTKLLFRALVLNGKLRWSCYHRPSRTLADRFRSEIYAKAFVDG
jgi:hypothetical protein